MPVHLALDEGVVDPAAWVPPSAIAGRRAARHLALTSVVGLADPVEANRLITRAHHELGELLADTIGRDTGPNFHTWAVWGSREAGRTIARRDIVGLTAWMALAGTVVGLALGGMLQVSPVLGAAIAATVAFVAAVVTRVELDRSRRHISHGNRIVLEEIGAATVDYIDAVSRGAMDDAGAVDRFFARLEASSAGAPDLLVRAFHAYDRARVEPDPVRSHQLVFAGNCFAVRHEHARLQHDIASAMARPLRRLITRRLLSFWVGDEALHVGRDLTPVEGTTFPAVLIDLVEPEARAAVTLLRDPDRAAGSLAGSAAAAWTDMDHRMNYVVDLFRSRHLSSQVWAEPYPGLTDRIVP